MCTDSRYLKIWEEIVSPSYFTFSNSCFGFDPATKYGMYEMHETVCLCTSAVPYGTGTTAVLLYFHRVMKTKKNSCTILVVLIAIKCEYDCKFRVSKKAYFYIFAKSETLAKFQFFLKILKNFRCFNENFRENQNCLKFDVLSQTWIFRQNLFRTVLFSRNVSRKQKVSQNLSWKP